MFLLLVMGVVMDGLWLSHVAVAVVVWLRRVSEE